MSVHITLPLLHDCWSLLCPYTSYCYLMIACHCNVYSGTSHCRYLMISLVNAMPIHVTLSLFDDNLGGSKQCPYTCTSTLLLLRG